MSKITELRTKILASDFEVKALLSRSLNKRKGEVKKLLPKRARQRCP